MQQMRRPVIRHASKQRKIVTSLQQPEMLQNPLLRFRLITEPGIRRNRLTQPGLVCPLRSQKLIQHH